jgi:hypothetical protein
VPPRPLFLNGALARPRTYAHYTFAFRAAAEILVRAANPFHTARGQKGLCRRACAYLMGSFQSGSSRTDSPVRVLHARNLEQRRLRRQECAWSFAILGSPLLQSLCDLASLPRVARRVCPSGLRLPQREVVTEFQSDSAWTDSPVRVLHAQPRSRLKLEVRIRKTPPRGRGVRPSYAPSGP